MHKRYKPIIPGNYNTGLGYGADVGSGGLTNATSVGYIASVTASNQVIIGNTNVTSIGGQVIWTAFSDERIKTNIQKNVPAVAFINLLQPVTYRFNHRKENELLGIKSDTAEWSDKHDIEKIIFTGFLAQQVDSAAKSIGYDFDGVDRHGNIWGLRYAEFVPSLANLVQELSQLKMTRNSN